MLIQQFDPLPPLYFCNILRMYELEREEHIMTHGQLEEALSVWTCDMCERVTCDRLTCDRLTCDHFTQNVERLEVDLKRVQAQVAQFIVTILQCTSAPLDLPSACWRSARDTRARCTREAVGDHHQPHAG